MSKILSFDIETGNTAADIGGWQNTHMWQVTCVTTTDGENNTVYIDKPVEIDGAVVKELKQLKFDLDDHFQKGGKLLGHNIVAFDLPILRDSMDIYCIHKYLNNDQYIDTSKDLLKGHGERFQLKNLVKCTMDDSKLMDSADAPKLWKMGKYDEVVEYCMKDTQLVYNLWGYGKENGIVKAFSIEKEEFMDLGVDW